MIKIGHRSGILDINSKVELTKDGWIVNSVGFARSARILMSGDIYLPEYLFTDN